MSLHPIHLTHINLFHTFITNNPRMSSIIEGYNYDIFISYRQKDNKHDGWVTKFVENLKGELEATFKEDISLYFDENPHDRLQETHNVDKSLEDKLKCLIFIPILSQTYCDPNSYAWQYEFLAFLRMVENDPYGKDVKLRSGNVANRILPIRIHDLEPEDVKLFEKETGSVLRALDFVFRTSTGVSRPLNASEEHPNDNLNNIFYNDQINKVGHAIKEIILGMKAFSSQKVSEKTQVPVPPGESRRGKKAIQEEKTGQRKVLNVRTISVSVIALAIIILGLIFIPKLCNPAQQFEKSIAVLPFFNDSPDDENTHFINGIMDEVLNNLQSIKEFRVVSRTSVEQYRGDSKPTIPEIAKKLNVNYIVEGSGQKYGSTFRLRVQLIDALNDRHLWAESYEREIKETREIFDIQSQIAESIASELETSLTPQEIEHFDTPPTANVKAYDAFLKGRYFYEKNISSATPEAIKWFEESIRLDSAFALPWTYLSMCLWRNSATTDSPTYKKAIETARKAVELDPSSGVAIVNMAEILDNQHNFLEAEEKIRLAVQIAPDDPYVLRNAGRFFGVIGRKEESISFCKRALQIDPHNSTALNYLFDAYFFSGYFQEARRVYEEKKLLGYTLSYFKLQRLLLAENKFDSILNTPPPEEDTIVYKMALAAANFATGKRNEAESIINELIYDGASNYYIAFAYSFVEDPENACLFLEKSYSAKEKILTYLKVEPAFERIRNEPRIRNIIDKMNFPE